MVRALLQVYAMTMEIHETGLALAECESASNFDPAYCLT
jgi:hypothetical protein